MDKKRKNKNDLIIRTCVITRNNDKKEKLLRFVLNKNNEYIFDENQIIQSRGIYIIKKLDIFQKFFNKYKVNIESADKVVKYIQKNNDINVDEKILNILTTIKKSQFLVYGFDENIEAIKENRVKLLIIPSDVNSKQINKIKKIAKQYEVKIVFIKQQYDLKKIFLSEVKIIGILSKKVVRGILNKVEV